MFLEMDEVKNDSRFSHIFKDPRFKKIPKKRMKVKIDKRFQSMFKEKKFQIKYSVDKRGRKIKLGDSEDLKRYYALSDSDEDKEDVSDDEEENDNENEGKVEDEKEETEKLEKQKVKEKSDIREVNESQNQDVIRVLDKDRNTLTPLIKKKLRDLSIDYARGEGAIFSDSSSDEESSEGEDDFFEFDHDWGELDKDAERTDKATKRLAVCNMNWDRIEATDLMVLFNSFLPAGGLIHSVTIYPSEFGLQKMKVEEEKGPTELTEELPEGEDEVISQIQMEKLRAYQLNRLKYYYAVVVCDTAETADALYKECDGLEYESSNNKLDLRFIPDDTTFDEEPRETCTSLPDLSTYKPKLFMTSALTKAKCDLTWDESDPKREEIVKSIHSGNVDENNLKKYIACSSSDEDSENEEQDAKGWSDSNYKIRRQQRTRRNNPRNPDDNSSSECRESFISRKNFTSLESGKKEKKNGLGDIDKYKTLLTEIEKKEKKIKENEVNLEVSWNLKLENKANEIVKEIAKEKEMKTPFQQYLEKRKEKKKKKRDERKALLSESAKGSDVSAFSDDDIPSDVDLNDPYFKEELDTQKSKKSSKAKKLTTEVESEESKQKKAELELLLLDNEPENLKHFSLKKIEEHEKDSKKKKRGKKRKAEEIDDFNDDFKIDVNDERFSALYTSHHFNIDPADPQFKPTKATKELILEKLRRRESEEASTKEKLNEKKEAQSMDKLKNAELPVLIKNIKRNTSEICKRKCH